MWPGSCWISAASGLLPAAEVVEALVDYVAPVLAEQGELQLARAGVERILEQGTGSQEQRLQRGDAGLAGVVAHAVTVTTRHAAGGAVPGSVPPEHAREVPSRG